MKEKVLITGANGFIGSFLVDEALRQGYKVVAGVRKSSRRDNLTGKDIQYLEMDYSSSEVLSGQLIAHGAIDMVIHNAGATYAPIKSDFQKVNALYARNLALALLKSSQPIQKFVHISSLSVHGPGDPVLLTPIQSSDPCRPISSYARSKLAGEEQIKSLDALPWLIFRPTAVYGPRDHDFFKLIKLIHHGYQFSIGTHLQMTSMIHAEDLARAVVMSLTKTKIHQTYLLSDGGSYNKDQIGAAIANTLGRKTLQLKIPAGPLFAGLGLIDFGYRLLGRQAFLNPEKVREISAANWLCDSQPFWSDLEMAPLYTLDKGIQNAMEWYKTNGWLPATA